MYYYVYRVFYQTISLKYSHNTIDFRGERYEILETFME